MRPANRSVSTPMKTNRVKNELPKFSEFGVVWFPFLGQPHPFNTYKFSSSTNPDFSPNDFNPKYDPENELFYFMLELYQFVKKTSGSSGSITKTQLSKTLNNGLPADWILRSGALSAINRIMRTRYTLDMRARDYDRFKGSLDFYNYFSVYSAQLSEFLQTPGGKLEIWLLSVHPEVREQLMLKYAEHFNVGGHPIYDSKTQDSKYQWLVRSLESSALDIHRAIRQKERSKRDKLKQEIKETIYVDDYERFDKDSLAGAKLDTGDGEVVEGGEVVRKFPTRPCQVMSIDYVPGFPDHEGLERLLMVQDRFTKGIFLEAVGSNDSPEVYWEKFNKMVKRAGGFPEQLISSGRRTRFKGDFDKFCEEYSIKHLKTSAYRPQIGGGLQQAKKRVMWFIKDRTNNHQSTEVFWPQVLHECEVDYNSRVNPVSRVTPYYCMYGHEVLSEIDDENQRNEKFEKNNKINTSESLEVTWRRVFYRLKAHADSATASYQRRTSNILPTPPVPSTEGEEVPDSPDGGGKENSGESSKIPEEGAGDIETSSLSQNSPSSPLPSSSSSSTLQKPSTISTSSTSPLYSRGSLNSDLSKTPTRAFPRSASTSMFLAAAAAASANSSPQRKTPTPRKLKPFIITG